MQDVPLSLAMLLRHGLAFAVPPTFVVIKKEWVMFESKA